MTTNVETMDQFLSHPLHQSWQQTRNEQRNDQGADSILYSGLLADSPAEFAKSGNIVCLMSWPVYDLAPITVTNGCVRIELPLLSKDGRIADAIPSNAYTLAEA
jgi:hypothetical protein